DSIFTSQQEEWSSKGISVTQGQILSLSLPTRPAIQSHAYLAYSNALPLPLHTVEGCRLCGGKLSGLHLPLECSNFEKLLPVSAQPIRRIISQIDKVPIEIAASVWTLIFCLWKILQTHWHANDP